MVTMVNRCLGKAVAAARLLRHPGKADRVRLVAIGHLLSGNFLSAALMLVSIAIAARVLEPERYGIMVMVLSFSRLVERVLRFESWQALIRFAAQEEQESNPERQSRLYAYGLLLDAGAAALAAFTSVALALVGQAIVGIEPQHVELVAIYAAALLLNLGGVPTAALRLAGRFRLLAYAQLVANVLRILLAALCAWAGAGLLGFMVAWTVAQICGSLIIFALGMRALASSRIPSPFKAGIRGLHRDFPGFLSFACSTNLSLTLRVITTEADSLFVGTVAGAPAAAIYHLAKRIAKVAMQVAAQVQAVIYPDVARMWARGNVAGFRRATLNVQVALGVLGVLMLAAAAIIAPFILRIGPGESYMSTYPLLLAQLVAVILTLYAAPSRSALLAMNDSWHVLKVSLVGTTIFTVIALLTVPRFGAIGANIAHVALGACIAVALEVRLLARLREHQAGAQHPTVEPLRS
ncbi:lipopolysaccharide biosynthesis protein [Novosphingobium sp. RD2P27]|uniref:Lipopolysaccharide biosynthesis protein n=1 Tax=Novosphingobium kalidii TaxID=3230299 RepID=A0ABV2D4A7_9SPHN